MKNKKNALIGFIVLVLIAAGLIYYFTRPVILPPELNIQPAPHESIQEIL